MAKTVNQPSFKKSSKFFLAFSFSFLMYFKVKIYKILYDYTW